jgi:shikimate kinase
MSFAAPKNRAHEPPPQARVLERIVLTGFMGSGKSTIGRNLAAKLGWRFVDLDDAIEQRDGRTVANIFADSGEPFFRALERDTLAACLREPRIVLALGGGALETAANRDAIAAADRTCAVLLTASFDTLYERCEQQIAGAGNSSLPVRPLLGDRAAAADRLARRDLVYRACAHVVLDTTGQTAQESLEALLKLLDGSL